MPFNFTNNIPDADAEQNVQQQQTAQPQTAQPAQQQTAQPNAPQNVPQHIRPHYPRMALTRAKARVLRDALNISITALEEVDGE